MICALEIQPRINLGVKELNHCFFGLAHSESKPFLFVQQTHISDRNVWTGADLGFCARGVQRVART